ncbi:MAG: CHASE2 domain-containing protein [Vulcanimicrobiota bacterium]
MKSRSGLVLSIGVAVWLLLSLLGQSALERRLYDLQYLAASERKGNPPLADPLVAAAIDREAFRQGLRADDLPEISRSLPYSTVDVAHQELSPYFEADPDGILRSVKLYEGSRLAPPFETYLRYRGIDPASVEISPKGVKGGGEFFPTDSKGRYYPYLPLVNTAEQGFALFNPDTLKALLNPENRERVVIRDHLKPVSLVHLLNGEADLEGRLVLLGVFLGEADTIEFDTPSGHMVRLELYTSLLNSFFKAEHLRPLNILTYGSLSLLLLWLLTHLLRGRKTLNSVGWWLLWTTAWLSVCQLFFGSNMVCPQSPVLVSGAVMLLVHLLRRSWRLRVLLQSLGGTAPLERTGDEIEATIMFTNLPDMIKDWEEANPERAQSARGAHSRCVGYLVNQFGGRLVDLQGDAQMLAFGLEGVGDHRRQAVACGLEIVQRVNALLDTPEQNCVHCGIVTGPVAVGLVGGGQYRGVAAIGDTTNSAARLMGQAKKLNAPVLASQETVSSLGPRATVEKAGELTVKGREKPLEAWKVSTFSTPPTPLAVDVAGGFRLPIIAFMASLALEAFLIFFLDQTLPLNTLMLDSLTVTHSQSSAIFAGLDEESMAAEPWPWPRSRHATIAKNCLDAGARAVFLDFLFEDSSTPQEDEKLASFVEQEPRVVVAAAAIPNEIQQPQPPEILPRLLSSGQWGLINHSPLNEGNRMRYAVWEMPIGSSRVPGVAKKLFNLLEGEYPRLDQKNDFLIRWGPAPPRVSYHRLLDPKDPVFSQMEGKIVFAGANLDSSMDAFETPRGLMKGAMIHAQSLSTILNDEIIVELQDSGLAFVLAFLLGMLILFVSWQAEGVGSQFALLVGGCLFATVTIRFAAKIGFYLGTKILIAVPVAIMLARIIAVLDAKKAVGQYIPRKLQQKLETEGMVADVTTTGTILLTDIRGYTTLSEGRSPREILNLLNSYHEKTARIYERFGGHLLTYQGDAQIVVFGPLQKLKNPVLNAVRSAQGIPAILEEVAREAQLEPGTLRVGAGITTGRITLSLLGIAGQMQYSVFGLPVRQAHHLQSLSDNLDDSIILDQRSGFEVKDLLPLKQHHAESGETFFTC